MVSRTHLEKSVMDNPSFINIESLDEFVSFDGINAYDGRVKIILKHILNIREYLMFKFFCNELFIDRFKRKFEDRIKVTMMPISSNPRDHCIEIDGQEYYLVGNDEQFESQFKAILRENKISDLLDEED